MSNENEASMISGVVRDASGEPVRDARVYFTNSPVPLPDIAALTNDEGEYSLTAPAAGTYKIGCTADGFAPLTREANVERGANAKVDFQLKRE